MQYFLKNPRQLFLFDGVGAIVSAFSLGVILVQYESFFGMPVSVLYYLAGAAVGFALYSFSCFIIFPKNWKPLMRLIALVNLTYCLVTVICMFLNKGTLVIWGYAYFIIEIIILIVLANLESNVAKNPLN